MAGLLRFPLDTPPATLETDTMPETVFPDLPIGAHFTVFRYAGATIYVKTSDTHAVTAGSNETPWPPHGPEPLRCYPVPAPPARPLPRTAAPLFAPSLLRFYRNPTAFQLRFVSLEQAQRLTRLPIQACESCDEPTFCHELQAIQGQDMCEDCAAKFTDCVHCGETIHQDDAEYTEEDSYCQRCASRYLVRCAYCSVLIHEEDTTYTEDGYVCGRCLDYHYNYCEGCDTYSQDGCDCNDGCDCEAPHQSFTFPANGRGTVQQDERIPVSLPSGTVDEEGLSRIRSVIYNEMSYRHAQVMTDLAPEWQTKRGNMTRRIASAIYKIDGTKVPPALLSKIGNIAREHSADTSTYHVEFTRDLNLPADHFCNEDSCWWESYYRSRCCLKNWGGLAIRSYATDDTDHDDPSGRAWIQPLTHDLKPTADTTTAHAYLVYNGYEDLDGYAAARIVAHLTGKTYRKIRVPSRGMDWYVNSNTGYLVADPATTAATESLSFPYDHHHIPTIKDRA